MQDAKRDATTPKGCGRPHVSFDHCKKNKHHNTVFRFKTKTNQTDQAVRSTIVQDRETYLTSLKAMYVATLPMPLPVI